MGFGNLGIGEILLILVVLLLVFGARRLPEIGSALGKGIREFKSSVRDIESDIDRHSVNEGQKRESLPQQRADAADAQQRQEPAQSQPRRESEGAEGQGERGE